MLATEVETKSLTLEEVAAITAAIEGGIPRDDVLADKGISVSEWDTSREAWLTKIAAEVKRGKRRLHRRFTSLVESHREEVAREAQSAKKKLDGPMPVAPAVSLASIGKAAPRDSTPDFRPAETPRPRLSMDLSPQPAPIPPAAVSPPPTAPVGPAPPPPRKSINRATTAFTMPEAASPVALPFREAASGKTPAILAEEPKPKGPSPEGGHTVAGAVRSPLADLPFEQLERMARERAAAAASKTAPIGPPSPLVSATAPPIVVTTKPDAPHPLSKTLDAPRMSPFAQGAPLPFAGGKPTGQKVDLAGSTPRPSPSGLPFAAGAREPSVGAAGTKTGPIAPSPLAGGEPPLPFAQKAPAPQPPGSNPPGSQPSTWGTPFQARGGAAVPPAPGSRPSSPPPVAERDAAGASAEQRAANMSLAQYAQVCADVRTAPEKSGEIRARLGFDAAGWTALHMLWQDRFKREPALKARWDALIEQALQSRPRP